jgi:peptidoglycan/LPS O-acetylase OafA/YrhL
MALRRVSHRWPLLLDGQVNPDGLVGAGLILAFFAFMASLNFDGVRSLKLPLSRLLGAISYPIYLLHALIGYIIIARVATDANKVAVWGALLVTVLVVSWALHEIVEVRMGPVWRRLGAATVGRGVGLLERAVGPKTSPAARGSRSDGQ